MKKRLFIGSFADRGLFEDFLPEIRKEMKDKLNVKWVEPENLHFTYKFLGDVESDVIDDLKKELSKILKVYETPIFINGINAFPNIYKPRVIYAKFFNPGKLVFKLRSEIEKLTVKMGFDEEHLKFRPHITLARVKNVNENPHGDLKKYGNMKLGKMDRFSVNLIESTLTKKGPIYEVIA